MVEYNVAKDEHGRYWHIVDVPLINRPKFTCPECGKDMISALGKKNKHHFRHLVKTVHDNESPLHQDTKWLFYQKLKRCIEGNIGFPLNFECQTYGEEYNRIYYGEFDYFDLGTKYCPNLEINPDTEQREFVFDLVKGASRIKVEKQIEGRFIPDVSLYDEKENLLMAIEIVHKHKDTEEKCDYYFQRGINVIHVGVDNEEDLLNYHRNTYSKITFNFHQNGCERPVITTSKMLMDNVHSRIEMKSIIAQQEKIELEKQEKERWIKRNPDILRMQEEKSQTEKEWHTPLKKESRVQDSQRLAEMKIKEQKLMDLGEKGVCFNCGNESKSVSNIVITEINSKFAINIYRCGKCYEQYVSSDEKLKKAINEIVSN
jgi:transcription elongation factor Elf1